MGVSKRMGQLACDQTQKMLCRMVERKSDIWGKSSLVPPLTTLARGMALCGLNRSMIDKQH